MLIFREKVTELKEFVSTDVSRQLTCVERDFNDLEDEYKNLYSDSKVITNFLCELPDNTYTPIEI